ncbi:Ribonuclease H domain [Abeliophyllum distichum]|uniref:Ribonuclease H domain n=1 Tax=Abeliophyllum distichum TaxID=126358 RepID=A0ABD1PN51_9LAMI
MAFLIEEGMTDVDSRPRHVVWPSIEIWTGLTFDSLKLNTYTTIRVETEIVGCGLIIRFREGIVKVAMAMRMVANLSLEDAEAIALQEGLILARNNALRVSQVECDALNVVQQCKTGGHCLLVH